MEKIETSLLTGIRPDPAPPGRIAAEFRATLEVGRLLPAGEAREAPERLLRAKYRPRHRVDALGTRFYLTDYRYDADLNFLVAYVVQAGRIHPRIFYKDSSLVWRVATHFVRTEGENWIGKGDVRRRVLGEHELLASAEETTDLPFEIQGALDDVSRRGERVPRDAEAVPLVLRRGGAHRIRPFADFSGPRRRAMERTRIHGGRPIARFARRGDPSSLRFAAGFAPDLEGGRVEVTRSASRLYGGPIAKHRILSRNRVVQFQFVVGPRHVWLNPPQALTTELSSYGVRTVDALAPEELFVPGLEYHYVDESTDPPELHSQIPPGFAGPASSVDPHRADASRWIERMPVIREFRARVLGRDARIR